MSGELNNCSWKNAFCDDTSFDNVTSEFSLGELDARIGFEDEVEYWKKSIAKSLSNDPTSFDYLLNPDRKVKEPYSSLISAYGLEGYPEVLDVGCGPLSVFGLQVSDKKIRLVGVDPLSNDYGEILDAHGIERPFEAMKGSGEELTNIFSRNTFDFVYSCNALDHSLDPALAIRQMIAVCKPDRHIAIEVSKNEAVNAAYTGLHQWNFDLLDKHVVLWNPGKIILLDDIIGGMPYVTSVHEYGTGVKKYPFRLHILIKKICVDNFTEVYPGVHAYFDRAEGATTIVNDGGIDLQFPCFLHAIRDGKNIHSEIFHFYKGHNVRSFCVDPNATEIVSFGQFDPRIASVSKRNIWKVVLK